MLGVIKKYFRSSFEDSVLISLSVTFRSFHYPCWKEFNSSYIYFKQYYTFKIRYSLKKRALLKQWLKVRIHTQFLHEIFPFLMRLPWSIRWWAKKICVNRCHFFSRSCWVRPCVTGIFPLRPFKMIMEIDDDNETIIAINQLIFCNYNKQKWQILIVSFAKTR